MNDIGIENKRMPTPPQSLQQIVTNYIDIVHTVS